MPLTVLLVLALVTGVLVAALARRLQPQDIAPTLALLTVVVGAVLVGVLALLLHGDPTIPGIDDAIARWAQRHASPASTSGLDIVTRLGSTAVVAILALLVATAEFIRRRNVLIVPFLICVIGGEHLLSSTIKQLVERARPALNPVAQTLGPSFPSGHTTAAAAFYAAAALLMSRGRDEDARAVLAATAAGIGVAVAASRVLLDVHWVTDVVGGLALGWSWTAICAIVFGRKLLTSRQDG